MPALDDILRARRELLEGRRRFRRPMTTGAAEGVAVRRCGREMISFSGNDYLGLARHPEAIAAANLATGEHGAGAGASRLVTGNHPFYDELEAKLAAWKGAEAACVFGSGYLANLGTISALMVKDDLIIADRLSHACLLDGARLSGAAVRRFVHNDVDNCRSILRKHRNNYKNCLLITESVFSMDGDLAPLDELSELAGEYDAWMLTDEAHAILPLPLADRSSASPPLAGGIEGGKPDAKYSPLPTSPRRLGEGGSSIRVGTLSKSLGSYGGYVCGSRELADYLKSAARSLVYSTALPPGAVAAASAALDVLRREPERAERALAHARLFASLMGLPPAQSAIVPLLLGTEEAALAAAEALEAAGFLVAAIRPPTVPPGTARLRVTFSAEHTEAQVRALARAARGMERRAA